MHVVMTNESINELLYQSLRIESPTLKQTNQAIVGLLENLMSGLSDQVFSLRELKQSMIPYGRLKFLIPANHITASPYDLTPKHTLHQLLNHRIYRYLNYNKVKEQENILTQSIFTRGPVTRSEINEEVISFK